MLSNCLKCRKNTESKNPKCFNQNMQYVIVKNQNL